MIRFTIALALFLLLFPAYSQELDEDCTQEELDFAADTLDALSAQLRSGDFDQRTILTVQITVSTLRAVCDGDMFSSETYGTDTVTDPIVFGTGFYRAVLESETPAQIDVKEFSGDCGILPEISVADEGHGEELWQFIDCIASLDISAEGDWVLRLEPILVEGE